MRRSKTLIQIPILLSLMTVASACGGQAYQTSSSLPYALGVAPTTTSNLPLPTATSTPTPTATTTPTVALIAPQSFNWILSGGTGTSMSIANGQAFKADGKFRVRVTSGAPTKIGSTGYTSQYTCEKITVTVGSHSQDAWVTYGNPPNNGPCGMLGYTSSSMTLNFDGDAGTGHAPLTVKVSAPQNDNCRTTSYANVISPSQGWVSFFSTYSLYQQYVYYYGFPPYQAVTGDSPLNYGGCNMSEPYNIDTHMSGSVAIHTDQTDAT